MRGAGARNWPHSVAPRSCSTGSISSEIVGRHPSPSAQAILCAPESSAKKIVQHPTAHLSLPATLRPSTLVADPESLSIGLQASPHTQRLWLDHLYLHEDPAALSELDSRVHSSATATTAATAAAADAFSARLDTPARPPGRTLPIFGGGCPSGDKDPNFYANVGSAIRTLRDEIPTLFYKDLTYDIYRPDIVFRDPRNKFTGIKDYKTIFWSLRFHGQLFFRPIYVEIKRLWQPEERELRLRWTVVGKPRVPWEAQGTFDGVSKFKLDKEGKIYEHQVDNVIFRDPPQSPLLSGLQLLQGLMGQQQQRPVPGMCRVHELSPAEAVEKLSISAYPSPGTSQGRLLHSERW